MVSMQKKPFILCYLETQVYFATDLKIYTFFYYLLNVSPIVITFFVCISWTGVNDVFLLLYSLGCGIGYGYLHRIPKRQFPSSKSSAVPSAPAPASVDGFAEVGSVMFISFWSVELRTVDSCTVLVVTGTLFCIFIENHLILDLILIKQYFGITNNWYFAQTIH